jgi:hypothetical protein
MAESGFVEGRSVGPSIVGPIVDPDRLAPMADELVRRDLRVSPCSGRCGHQAQFAPLRLSACSWFGEVTFIGTSLKRETRRFLPFAGPLSRSFFHA